MRVTIGVSLKAYFGYRQTVAWCRQLPAITQPHERHAEVFVLPAFPVLAAAVGVLAATAVRVGAQDLCADDDGARTGEVGGAILTEIGCRYVEVGHAERRTLYGETDTVVAAKLAAAFRHGLTPVLCVGEPDRVPADTAIAVCRNQITSALRQAVEQGLSGPLVIAYEPHWAIGAVQPAPDAHIARVCAALRQTAADARVIYGGSAGPGLLTRLGDTVDGLFLGRSVHDPAALADVLAEGADRRLQRTTS